MRTPGLSEVTRKSAGAPSLTIETSCAAILRSQKFPRNVRSVFDARTRGSDCSDPTGNTVTPLSEMA
jgi:hypothetical protein